MADSWYPSARQNPAQSGAVPKQPPFDAQGVQLLNRYEMVKQRNQGAATRSELDGDAADELLWLIGDTDAVAQRGRMLLSLLGMPVMEAKGVDPVSKQVIFGQAAVRSNSQIEQGMQAAREIRARLDNAGQRIDAIIAAAQAGVAPGKPEHVGDDEVRDIKGDITALLEATPANNRMAVCRGLIADALKPGAPRGAAILHTLLGEPMRLVVMRLQSVDAGQLAQAYIEATAAASPSGEYAFGGPKGARFLLLQRDGTASLNAMVAAALAYFDYRFRLLNSLVEK